MYWQLDFVSQLPIIFTITSCYDLCIEVHVPSQGSERSYICVLEVSIMTNFDDFFLLDLTVETVCYYLLFILLTHYGFSFTQHLQNMSIGESSNQVDAITIHAISLYWLGIGISVKSGGFRSVNYYHFCKCLCIFSYFWTFKMKR